MSVRGLMLAGGVVILVPDPGTGVYYNYVNKNGPNGTPYDPGSGRASINNMDAGLWRRTGRGDWYTGNFATTDMGFLWNGTPILQQKADSYVSFGNQVDRATHYSMEWLGYVYIPTTGTYDFCLVSDDQSMMWIGDRAISGYTGSNRHADSIAQLNPNSALLTGGLYYPIRIWYNEVGGANSMQLFLGQSGSPGTLTSMINWITKHDSNTKGLNP